MNKPFHLEVASPGLRAKLDLKYRRSQKEKDSDIVKSRINQIDGETALPFTTKTRAYGTYSNRK